jgi:threonine aldolase
VPASDYAASFDTVSVCFSKGLGAPVGSALTGTKDFIDEARRFKQMFGGGMRQSGIIAAGALYALDTNRERLPLDHDHALRFAEAIGSTKSATIDLDSVHTNIVYFDVKDPARVVDESLDAGVAMLVLGATRIRAVFHLDVTDEDTTTAIDTVTSVIEA